MLATIALLCPKQFGTKAASPGERAPLWRTSQRQTGHPTTVLAPGKPPQRPSPATVQRRWSRKCRAAAAPLAQLRTGQLKEVSNGMQQSNEDEANTAGQVGTTRCGEHNDFLSPQRTLVTLSATYHLIYGT